MAKASVAKLPQGLMTHCSCGAKVTRTAKNNWACRRKKTCGKNWRRA